MPVFTGKIPFDRVGVLEIVIDSNGGVESATMVQPSEALYDRRLLAAAKTWVYRPARLDGAPVKYRRRIQVTLARTQSVPSGTSWESFDARLDSSPLPYLLVLAFAGGWIVGFVRVGAAVDIASLTDVERQFTERMRDVRLVGTFTVAGREARGADGQGGPRTDTYDIASVEKVGDNLWRFNAGMQCCGVKGQIPIVIPMRFVGDTPMIMMTDTEIPGVGTFTVRLFFYGDTYSGTWQHGKVGGHMSGRIEKKAS